MSSYSAWNAKAFILSFVLAIPTTVFANDILSTEGFQSCQNNASVTVNQMNIQFDRSTNLVVFDVSGTSTSEQFVNASLTVSAYGHEIYSKQFDPCDETTKVQQLCPGMNILAIFIARQFINNSQFLQAPSPHLALKKYPPNMRT